MTHAAHGTEGTPPEPAVAAERLERALGRRTFVQAALATGALAAA
ncbi:MAG: hypothetical protein JWP46_4405, partial [Modestobacter sp.]|nr:hypothetical protein [Modestobacter sp.]